MASNTSDITSINKPNSLQMFIMLIVFGLIGSTLYVLSRAAPTAPTIYLNSSSQTFAANSTFTVEVRENSGTTGINALQANFSYPANLVDFISIDTSTSAFQIIPEATGGAGSVNIAAAISGGSAPLSGDKLIGIVTFKTKSLNGTVDMNFTSGTLLLSATDSTDLLGSLNATGGATFYVDLTPPTVSITSPSNGAVVSKVSGSNLSITATATDDSAVSKVDILINGALQTSLTTSPYTFSVSTLNLPLGDNTISARAYDPYGNSATSSTITVVLADQTAPTINITQPTSGATVSATTTVTASASDNTGGSGISKVEFYIDGALVRTDTVSPYNYSWDTTTYTDSTHSLTARAYDFATPQNSKLSSAVSVTVDNSDKQPPTAPGNLRMTSRTTSSIAIAWDASTDNIGVTGYRISRNGTLVTTTTQLGYTDNNVTANTTYSYSVTAVDAANNVSNPSATLSITSLKIGDVDGDGKVGILDISILLTNFRAKSTDANWDTAKVADLNNNGEVEIIDLSMMLVNYDTST